MKITNSDLNIHKIRLCCLVKSGHKELVHVNRKSYGLAYHRDGDIAYTFKGGETYALKEHGVIFLPKGSDYSLSHPLTGDCYAINFNLFEDLPFEPIALSVKNHAEVESCFKKAVYYWEQKAAGYEMKCRSLLYNIIFILQSEHNRDYQSSEKMKLLLPAMDHIAANYTRPDLRIADLCRLCGIGETYFRKVFFDFYGTTPVKYVSSLRLRRAAELLKFGDYSVSDVMTMCGYDDPAYFCRSFKKYFGVSPSRYKSGEIE